MSQTLQNQILLAKSMNGIVSLSDGAGTTITGGQVITNDFSGNTITVNSFSTGTMDLNNSLTLEQYDNISTVVGSVSLWEKGKSYFTYLPQSLATPSNTSDLITLLFGDANYGRLTASNTWSNTNIFTGGITATGTQTITFGTNAPTMSGGNIAATSIPDAALSTNVALLTGTQTFTGRKIFNGGINASPTQVVNFGSNAPTMSGGNIAATSIPDGALSTNVALLTGTQTFSGTKTFTGGITATGTQTITFGTNAPTMRGNNIAATSIPDSALTSNVPLKNGTNTFTGANTFSNLTFSNVSSSITLTNPAFQLPLKSVGTNFTALVSSSSTTYAPNATFLTAQGFTGWGFSGTSYTAGIQESGGGTYYMTYYPIGNQCLILAPNGNNMNMKSENYTLAKGEYVFSFQLQTQYMEPNSSITASVVLGSTTIESTSAINPRTYYPNWTTYQFGFVVPTSGSYYFNFAFTSTTGSDYVGISATTLVLNNCMSVSDGTNTSAIGGSQSVLNSLFVRNSLTVESGGMNVEGSVNMGTAYGSNNIAINSPMGSVAGTTNSGVIAIGTGALQNGTGLINYIGIGTSSISYTSAASNMVVIGGSCASESSSTIIGWGVISSAPVGFNAIVGSSIGSGVGDYNSILGCNIFRGYNGYGTLFPNYNCVVGYNSQNASADSYNTSVGVNSLALMDGLNGTAYNTQYNTAVGYNSGSSQARINYCTFLGSGADVNTNNLSYATAIGAGAIATTSNSIYLGRGTDITYFVGGANVPTGKTLTIDGTLTVNAQRFAASPLKTAAFTVASDGIYWRTYPFTMTTAASYSATLPEITAANEGQQITFRRIGGSAQALTIIPALTTGSWSFRQIVFLTGTTSTIYTTPFNIISAAQNSATLVSTKIQDFTIYTGTATWSTASTTITVSATPVNLMIGGVIRLGAGGAQFRQITAYGTGLGGTGTYVINALPTTNGTGLPFAVGDSYGWMLTSQQ